MRFVGISQFDPLSLMRFVGISLFDPILQQNYGSVWGTAGADLLRQCLG